MYTVVLSTHAKRDLRKLEKDVQQRIVTALDLLSEEPRPPKSVALANEKSVHVQKKMNTLTTVELRANLADVLGRVRHGHERIVITKSGKPVAGLIPYDELEAIEALEDQLDREALAEARAEGGRHVLKEVKKELGLD